MNFEIICGDYRDVAVSVGEVDSIVTDPPYSSAVHEMQTDHETPLEPRRKLAYASWGLEDVLALLSVASDVASGWVVALSCHRLIKHYETAGISYGLTTFQPVPCVISGMTVRLAGDGPSSWAVYANVARPKSLHKWGTLPGAYVGKREKQPHIGGKPLWLMRALIRDYTRPGDLVFDPCCGSGTTGVACIEQGRRFIGCDIDQTACDVAYERIDKTRRQGVLFSPPPRESVGTLF